jgi:hypothetical protein
MRGDPRPVLTFARRRRVDRQVAGRRPHAAHEVPFLRDVAWRFLRSVGITPV